MSIKTEITRIKNNIASAYTACENKGAELPEIRNSNNLALTINNLQVGESSRYGLTLDNLWGKVDANGKLLFPESGNLIADGIVRIEDYILANKFGGYAYGVTKKRGIKSIVFPDLTYVGNAAMYQFCTYTSDLESISFPELENIGQCAMENAFKGNSNLKSAYFPKLKKLTGMYSSLEHAFDSCKNLEQVNFDSLENLTKKALVSAFERCTNLKTISFPSLTNDSFNGYTDQFTNMLRYITGCTVHFPIKIKKTIENWTDVIAGFGGTETIILFDLHAATLNFITSQENINIYIDKDLIEDNTVIVPAEDTDYLAFNTINNTILFDTVTGLEEDVTEDIIVNFSQQTKKITTSIGVSDLSVIYIIDGIQFEALEESKGNYTVNVIGNNKEIEYFIDGGNGYKDVSGTINYENNNISNSINLIPATVSEFTRPNLTSNGTLDGDDFAVSSDDAVGGYSAYYAVNGDSNYFWMVNNNTPKCRFVFYNPNPLKVSQLVFYYTSTTYSASTFLVEGSNDNESWVEIGEYNTSKVLTQTLNVNSSRFYKYHRITFNNSTIRLKNLEISALQKG